MNEQLQGKLVEILAGIQSATKAAGDFAMEQLPDIAQQYLLYGRIHATVTTLTCIMAVICFFIAANRVANKEDCSDKAFPFFFATAMSGLPVTIAAFGLGNLIMVWVAPKVWLLKELASLIK